MRENQKSVFDDKLLRRIAIVSTGLAFAAGFGTLAALNTQGNHGLQLTWHWTIVPCAAAGAVGNWRLWAVILESEGNLTSKGKRKFCIYCGLLTALGVGVFLYPIRFVDQSRWRDIAQGLIAAAGFLGTLGYLIFRLSRGFAEADSIEQAQNAGDAPDDDRLGGPP